MGWLLWPLSRAQPTPRVGWRELSNTWEMFQNNVNVEVAGPSLVLPAVKDVAVVEFKGLTDALRKESGGSDGLIVRIGNIVGAQPAISTRSRTGDKTSNNTGLTVPKCSASYSPCLVLLMLGPPPRLLGSTGRGWPKTSSPSSHPHRPTHLHIVDLLLGGQLG